MRRKLYDPESAVDRHALAEMGLKSLLETRDQFLPRLPPEAKRHLEPMIHCAMEAFERRLRDHAEQTARIQEIGDRLNG